MWFAMSIAASPTPPPALWISTVSPGFSEPMTTRSCHAVRYATGTDAACSCESAAGFWKTWPAGTEMTSE